MSASKAQESLRAGDVERALRELEDQVRSEPAVARHRVFLFQLLSVLGRWTRAAAAVDVASELDPNSKQALGPYRQAIACEGVRADVIAGKRPPAVLGKAPGWAPLLARALRSEAAGAGDEARVAREQAAAEAPRRAGTLDGARFTSLADEDPRFGPMLELILAGNYYWAPLAMVRSIEIPPPRNLRDAVWLPARLTWVSGDTVVGLIPTRYPGSEAAGDPALALSRKTEWREGPAGPRLYGQRMLAAAAGAGEPTRHAVMDVRSVSFDAAAE